MVLRVDMQKKKEKKNINIKSAVEGCIFQTILWADWVQ